MGVLRNNLDDLCSIVFLGIILQPMGLLYAVLKFV